MALNSWTVLGEQDPRGIAEQLRALADVLDMSNDTLISIYNVGVGVEPERDGLLQIVVDHDPEQDILKNDSKTDKTQ